MLYRNQGVFNLFLSIAALKEAASSKMIPDEQKLIEAIEEIEGSRHFLRSGIASERKRDPESHCADSGGHRLSDPCQFYVMTFENQRERLQGVRIDPERQR